MSSTRVVLVELRDDLAALLTEKLSALGVQVAMTSAAEAVPRLTDDPPALALINLELSQGSGFGLINRLLRMETLSGLEVLLVAENTTDEALAAHRSGPTPADAYVKRKDGASDAAFAEEILEAAQGLLTDPLPEVDSGAVEEADKKDPLELLIAELGTYRVLSRLRDEDGAAVFACRDEELHRNVAIKLMQAQGDGDEDRVKRFQRERRILALLHSPYVVAIYGAGTHKGTPYVVRELIDGESLAEQIARDGALDVGDALQRVRETALGLRHAAAAGVIHRDVRPENIHVVNGHAKIARFAMGRRADDARITRGGVQPVDMTYVAPERVRGQEDVRADVYALGVTLYTLIAGRSPFTTPMCIDVVTGKYLAQPMHLEDARPGTSSRVGALVAKMMAEDPAQRPQDYDEVVALIDETVRAITDGDSLPQREPEQHAVDEPSAVHGTLRLMSVVEIVQSLELARKTATVFLPSNDEPEGRLAFEAGRVVHASFGELSGTDAFYALVSRKSGAFRVQYDALSLEKNIEAPVTALLLEAARRADDSARDSPETPMTEEAPPSISGFFQLDEERPTQAPVLPVEKQQRHVPTLWGFAVIALVSGAAVYGGLRAPPLVDVVDDDPSSEAVAALLGKHRDRLRAAREQLSAVQPKLAAYEAEQASALSEDENAKQRATEVHKNLEVALKPELADRRFTLRLADDAAAVIIEIGELALFAADGEDVLTEKKTSLARIAGALAPLDDVRIRVEGHTDDSDAPRKFRDNWMFSAARAASVASVLTSEGLSPARVEAVAFADTRPVVANKGKQRARNRRVELHLSPK